MKTHQKLKPILILACIILSFKSYPQWENKAGSYNPAIKSLENFETTNPEPEVWYTFDSLGSTVYDISGNNHHGNIVNSVTRNEGSVSFYRDDGYIEIPATSNLNGAGDFTVAFNTAMDNLDSYDYMRLIMCGTVESDANYIIYYRPDYDLIGLFNKYYGHKLFLNINDTLFHELAFVFKDTVASIYFDGETIEKDIMVYSRENIDRIVRIGQYCTTTLDEFKFYNAALNSYQVKTIFNQDTVSPSIPENLNGNISNTNLIELRWNASQDIIGVYGYEIYRDSMLIGTSASTNYTDTVADSNAVYQYTARAFDYCGNYSGFADTLTLETCKKIEIEYLSSDYAVCHDSSITINTNAEGNNLIFSWQIYSPGGWKEISDNEFYSNSQTHALQIQGINYDSLPQVYRLGVENNCGTFFSDSVLLQPMQLNSVYGTVIAGEKHLEEGTVYLYPHNGSTSLNPLDSAQIINGRFALTGICPNYYKLKAKPLGQAARDYSESFYSNAGSIEEATIISVKENVHHVVISLGALSSTTSKSLERGIDIYPTIIENELNIRAKAPIQEALLTITNIYGSVAYSKRIENMNSTVQLNLSGLPAGAYYLQISSKNKAVTSKKIIVQH